MFFYISCLFYKKNDTINLFTSEVCESALLSAQQIEQKIEDESLKNHENQYWNISGIHFLEIEHLFSLPEERIKGFIPIVFNTTCDQIFQKVSLNDLKKTDPVDINALASILTFKNLTTSNLLKFKNNITFSTILFEKEKRIELSEFMSSGKIEKFQSTIENKTLEYELPNSFF